MAVAGLAAEVGWRAGLGDLNAFKSSGAPRLLLLSANDGLSPPFPLPKVFSCRAGCRRLARLPWFPLGLRNLPPRS